VVRRTELERSRRTWLVIDIVLAVVLLVTASTTVVLGGFAGYSAYQEHRIREGHREASAAARQVVVDFLTISAASVTRDLGQVLDGSTGEFRKQYQAGMSEVRTAVVENKVASTGKVLRSGVVSGDADSASVLVAVDARITNVRSPKGRKAHYRVQVDMVYDAETERWLVSRLEFVG
jgi:Mce-associated membrane protein